MFICTRPLYTPFFPSASSHAHPLSSPTLRALNHASSLVAVTASSLIRSRRNLVKRWKKFHNERVRFERVRRARRVAVCGFRKSLIHPTVLVGWEMSEIFRGMNRKTPMKNSRASIKFTLKMHEITHTTSDAILHGRRLTRRRWKARKMLQNILANQRYRRGFHATRRARRRKFTFFAIIFEIVTTVVSSQCVSSMTVAACITITSHCLHVI